jgi:hypothetical protein
MDEGACRKGKVHYSGWTSYFMNLRMSILLGMAILTRHGASLFWQNVTHHESGQAYSDRTALILNVLLLLL